jgi:hypothetical protein
MTREESQLAWKKIVDKGFSDYSKLNRDERVWFNIEPLVELGLWDHYMNSGADHNADTIDDLEYLNFSSIANLLRKFNIKYFPIGVPIGPDARAEKLGLFPEDQLEKDIEEMEEFFWANS